MAVKDGGSAFPHPLGVVDGVSLRDWFASQASEPSADWISMQRQFDRNRNPHNDYHKPRLREEVELIAAYKYMIADAMLAEREKGNA
jgi:hypothetical protein